jgi:mRNA-degrading endonuclease RelE of RelBE toxin-antitoxin system
MNIFLTPKADRDYESLSPEIQTRVKKQFGLLLGDLRHPSIRAKKYDESNDIWQGRVNRSYRFYFQIDGDDYVILAIIPHPK